MHHIYTNDLQILKPLWPASYFDINLECDTKGFYALTKRDDFSLGIFPNLICNNHRHHIRSTYYSWYTILCLFEVRFGLFTTTLRSSVFFFFKNGTCIAFTWLPTNHAWYRHFNKKGRSYRFKVMFEVKIPKG
jgi:hypothetical protein